MTLTLPDSTVDTIPSSSDTASDAHTSDLVEAVTALKVVKPSLPAKMPLAKAMKVGDDGGVDSGYASKNSSQSSTPDKFVVNGRRRTRLFGIPTREKLKLLQFDKPIPRLTQDRFEDLRELYADNLNKLTQGLPRCRGILMSLKVFGESESTAAPWVFIQCDRAVAGKVRCFFKQPFVESDYKPPHPDAHNPKFGIYVHEMPPMPLHGMLPPSTSLQIDVPDHDLFPIYGEPNTIISSGSLCGSKISVSTDGQLRSATIGGIISIRWKNGPYQALGLTAGHFLGKEQYLEYPVDEADYIDDLENVHDYDEQGFELDLGPFDHEAPTSLAQDATQSEISEVSQATVGRVCWTSEDNLQSLPNLDWALFTIEDTSLSLPNVVAEHQLTRVNHPNNIFGNPVCGKVFPELNRKVVLATATSGIVSGTLSTSWSYIMLAPGRSLVRVNALTISDTKALKPGDSGAWVVDDATSIVYGHVVASDVFGTAYVVPADDVFEDIRVRLSLDAVDLPAKLDIISRLQINTEEQFTRQAPDELDGESKDTNPTTPTMPAAAGFSVKNQNRYSDSGYSTLNSTPEWPSGQHSITPQNRLESSPIFKSDLTPFDSC